MADHNNNRQFVNSLLRIDTESSYVIYSLIQMIELEIGRMTAQGHNPHNPSLLCMHIKQWLDNKLEILELRNRIQLLKTICMR